MKVLICGAGRATRALLRRMGAGWDATVVDNGPDVNEFIQEFESVSRAFSGDASSPVVLGRAGLAEHDWVLAMTSDDEVNLAVVRFAVETGIKHVVARVMFPENKAAMEEAGARTFSGIAVMAAEVMQYLRNPRVRVISVARGRGEVLEVEVGPRSGMAGSTLESLSSPDWHVAAVFRGARMLIQTPELTVVEGDILIVVAEPDRYEAVCDLMQCVEMDFPQVYGRSILAALPEDEDGQRGVLAEALHLAQGTMIESLTLVADAEAQAVRDGVAMWSESLDIRLVSPESRPYAQVEALSQTENVGIVVVPWTEPSLLKSLTRRTPLKLAHALDCPLLIAKSTVQYKKILVPFTGSKTTELALDIALQMGARFGAQVTVVLVREPEFLHGVQEDWVPKAIALAREQARTRSMGLSEEIREGNPVLETTDMARDYDLIVLGSGAMDGAGLLNPDVGGAYRGQESMLRAGGDVMILDQAWTLMLICLAAVILPGLSRLLRLPEVALQILFGVLLGKSVLHLEIEGHFLPFLAELGFLMLMFQAGMELDFGAMSRQSKGRMAFQGLLFGVTFALAIGAAMALDQGVFTALILTTTSLGLVVPSLKEAGIIRSDLGQSVLLAATVADFMTLFGITFYVLWMLHGMSWQLIAPLPFFILVGILLKLARLWAWWNPDKAAQALAADDAQEFGVRLSLALLFLLVALSEVVHLEPVLGAFIGGAVLAFVFRERMALETKLSGMAYGFFIPMFFIHVGMQFDVANIATPERLAMTGVLLLVALGVKLVPGLMLRLLGYGWRESVAAGLLLASRLSLIIAAASIGLDYGLVTPEFKDSIVLLAVCTCLLGPTLFKLVMPRRSTPP